MYLTWSRRSSDSPRSCSRGPASGRETRGWGGGQGERDRGAGPVSPLASVCPSTGRRFWPPSLGLLDWRCNSNCDHYSLVMFSNLLTVTSCITPESLSHRPSQSHQPLVSVSWETSLFPPLSSLTRFMAARKRTGWMVLAGIIPDSLT